MDFYKTPVKPAKKVIALLIFYSILFILVQYNISSIRDLYNPGIHLELHTILEMFSIFVSFFIFIQSILLYKQNQFQNMLVIGVSFLIIGVIDSFHTLTYNGMPSILLHSSIQRATWFWIFARFTEAISISFLFILLEKSISKKSVFTIIGFESVYLIAVLAVVIGYENKLPLLVIEGEGTTLFKNSMEYLISFIHLANIVFIVFKYKKDKNRELLDILLSLYVIMLGEFVFTLYNSVHDINNGLGHIYKVIGYYYLLKGLLFSKINRAFAKKHQMEKDLKNILRQQQGILFKFIKMDNQFIHTMCDGELLYRIGVTPQQVVKHDLKEFLSIKEANYIQQFYNNAWNFGKEQIFETVRNRITIIVSLRPILSKGKVIEVIGSCIDITHLKETESKLKESEILFKEIFNHANDAIFLSKLDESKFQYRFIEVNDMACKRLGYTHEELTKLSPKEINVPDSSYYLDLIEELKKNRTSFGEVLHLTKENIEIPVELNSRGFRIDNQEYILSIARDISERKLYENQLRDTFEVLETTIGSIPVGILAIDNNRHIRLCNEKAKEILELKLEHLVNVRMPFKLDSFIAPLLNKKQDILTKEFKYKQSDGSFVDIQIKSAPMFFFQEQSDGWILVISDITEEKKAELFMQTAQKLSLAGRLAAGVAHEIRNPLTSLKGFAQILQGVNKDQKYSTYYGIMLSEIDRINQIVSEFMELAKTKELKFADEELITLIQDIVDFMKTQAILVNVTIETYFDPNLSRIKCDKDKIKQVMVNLIKNAMEAMPDGGNLTINVGQSGDRNINISVEDEGCGIPQEKIDRLGEPFYTTKEQGTGLGLSICYKIIEHHNGYMEVHSEQGVGTEFKIQLPIDPFESNSKNDQEKQLNHLAG